MLDISFNAKELQFIYSAVIDLRYKFEDYIDENMNSPFHDQEVDGLKTCNSILRKVKTFANQNGLDIFE